MSSFQRQSQSCQHIGHPTSLLSRKAFLKGKLDVHEMMVQMRASVGNESRLLLYSKGNIVFKSQLPHVTKRTLQKFVQVRATSTNLDGQIELGRAEDLGRPGLANSS
jgi:hypothetical protein